MIFPIKIGTKSALNQDWLEHATCTYKCLLDIS